MHVSFETSIEINLKMAISELILTLPTAWWNDNRWPHQKTSTLDDVIARNST